MPDTIYHRDACTGLGLAIKLNLKAVRELHDREVPHFDSLTTADKKLLSAGSPFIANMAALTSVSVRSLANSSRSIRPASTICRTKRRCGWQSQK